jgi:hypothetical protein
MNSSWNEALTSSPPPILSALARRPSKMARGTSGRPTPKGEWAPAAGVGGWAVGRGYAPAKVAAEACFPARPYAAALKYLTAPYHFTKDDQTMVMPKIKRY